MSSACSSNLLLNSSPSPTSTHRHRASESSPSDQILNKYIHIDSPRSSPTLFKRPSPSPSKWKAVLAHLSPPRLLPVPASLRSYRSRRPSDRALTAPISDTRTIPAPVDITTSDIQPVPTSTDIATSDHHISPIDIPAPDVAAVDHISQLTSCNPSLSTSNDVHQLLSILTERIDVTDVRSHALASLYSLCVASPSAVDLCVAERGVDIILNTLNICYDGPTSTAVMAVEQSEKALLLLQLLTSSSADGCAAALRQSQFAITTLGRKLLRMSEACTASSIAVLTALCKHPEAAPFCKAVSETAIPSKLVVVLQVASKDSTKRRAGRLLRLLQ